MSNWSSDVSESGRMALFGKYPLEMFFKLLPGNVPEMYTENVPVWVFHWKRANPNMVGSLDTRLHGHCAMCKEFLRLNDHGVFDHQKKSYYHESSLNSVTHVRPPPPPSRS